MKYDIKDLKSGATLVFDGEVLTRKRPIVKITSADGEKLDSADVTARTEKELEEAKECFDIYIKTVIDLKKKICSAGCDRHFESEKILLNQDSKQEDLWGGGIDLETKAIDCNSFINIRPSQKNTSNEIQDERIREQFIKLMRYFFGEIYG